MAYFFHIDPAAVLGLSMDRFGLYEKQAVRIAAAVNDGG